MQDLGQMALLASVPLPKFAQTIKKGTQSMPSTIVTQGQRLRAPTYETCLILNLHKSFTLVMRPLLPASLVWFVGPSLGLTAP